MNQRKLAAYLLAPAFILVAFTTIYPLISSFWTSFHVFNLARSLELGRFVGFENYVRGAALRPGVLEGDARHCDVRRRRCRR